MVRDVVRGAQDVLDALYGVGVRAPAPDRRPELSGDAAGCAAARSPPAATPRTRSRAPGSPRHGRSPALASLELSGYVQTGAGREVLP